MTESPWPTHELTPDWLSSMPRPSTLLCRVRWASSAPSPQPMSSTRAPGSIISAISLRSWRNSPAGSAAAAGRAPASSRLRDAVICAPVPLTGQSAMLGAPGQEAAQGREQLWLVQQKGVVSVLGRDLDKADIGRHRVQGVDQFAAFGGREQPVAGERDHAKARARAGEGARQRTTMLSREIEVIHRPGYVEIGVGVEAVDKGAALVAQIALDLEIGVEAVGDRTAVLQIAPELAVQRRLRKIGDVRRHAGDGEAARGAAAGTQIAARAPVGIGDDRLTADLVKGDVLRRMTRRGGDRHGGEDAFRIARSPLQYLHAAHRAT